MIIFIFFIKNFFKIFLIKNLLKQHEIYFKKIKIKHMQCNKIIKIHEKIRKLRTEI